MSGAEADTSGTWNLATARAVQEIVAKHALQRAAQAKPAAKKDSGFNLFGAVTSAWNATGGQVVNAAIGVGVGLAAGAACVGTVGVGCAVVGAGLLTYGTVSTGATLLDSNVSAHDKWVTAAGFAGGFLGGGLGFKGGAALRGAGAGSASVAGAASEFDVASGATRGGVYSLRNQAGDILRTGRTSDLAAREAAHARDPVLSGLKFNTEYRTDIYAEQRGLEQVLYDRYPGALSENGGFNKIRPKSIRNPNLSMYMQAAWTYLGMSR